MLRVYRENWILESMVLLLPLCSSLVVCWYVLLLLSWLLPELLDPVPFGALGCGAFTVENWILESMVLLLMLRCVWVVVALLVVVFLRPAPNMSLNILRCVRCMSVSVLFVRTHA